MTSAAAAAPTGSVQFYVNGNPIGGLVALDNNGQASFDLASLSAGAHTIAADYVSDNLSAFIDSDGSTSQTVAPAPLTVAADAQIKTQGQANPALTACISGFVLGQTLANSDVLGLPSLSTTAISSSPAGAYPIAVGLGGLTSTDYSFQFVNSVLYVVTSAGDAITNAQSSPVSCGGCSVCVCAAGANASSPQMTATAGGFDGTLTAAQFASIPTAGIAASGAYFDVHAAMPAGTSMGNAASVTLQFQNLTPNVPLFWSSGGAWTEVLDGSGQPVVADAQGNATVVFSGSTTPTLAQLSGTYFTAGQFQPQFSNVAAQQATYGAPTATFAGSLADGSMIPGGTITATLGSDVETAAVQSDGSFNVTFETATLAANGSPYNVALSYAGDSSFLGTSGSSQLTVAPAPLTIAAVNQTKVYGAALPTLTASYSGFVNGDNSGSLTTQPAITTTATAASRVTGSPYAITASGAADPNYTIRYVPGTLTVTPAPLTITAVDQTKVYGAPLPTLTANYSGFVNGDTSAGLTTLPTFATTAACTCHVSNSPYSITASGAADPNYTIGYVAGSLTVTPAPLTIAANNQTKVYGAPLPTLTAGYSGLVNGDTSASLTAQPTLATTATALSHVTGSPYAITASGAADPDYNIGYVAGTLTVSTYAFTYTIGSASQTYGSPANLAADLPATIATNVNGQNLAITYSSTGDTATAPVGTYAITGAVANGTGLVSDYTVTLNPGTLTVNPAVAAPTSTAIVSAPTITYGAVGVVAVTVSSTYAVPTDNVSLVASGGSVSEIGTSTASANGLYKRTDVFAVAGLTAGDHALSASYSPAGNFAGSTASGNLHVNKAPLTVVANSQSKVYGAAMPTLTGGANGRGRRRRDHGQLQRHGDVRERRWEVSDHGNSQRPQRPARQLYSDEHFRHADDHQGQSNDPLGRAGPRCLRHSPKRRNSTRRRPWPVRLRPAP